MVTYRLQAVSFFFLVRRAKRPRRANDHARERQKGRERLEAGETFLASLSRRRRSTLAGAFSPLTKSEEKERLIAVEVTQVFQGLL